MADSPEMTVRVWYAGRVQGVGFRYTVVEIVRGHPVVGYVKNLADGRVELLLQGSVAEIESLLQAISERFRGNIRGADRQELPTAVDFERFEIRH